MSNLEKSNKEFYHSPSDFALSENDYYIYAAIKKSESEFDCPLVVRYSVNDNKASAFMQPYHDVSSNDTTFGIYYTIVPSSFIDTGKELKYEFFCDSESLGAFSVPVFNAGTMPPLIITEIYARPRGTGTTSFIELTNLTSNDVDLYDYKLMLRKGKIIDYKIPPLENYFVHEKGKYIVPAGKTAVVFFCIPKNHNGEDSSQLTKEGFCKTLIAEDFRENFCLPCDELIIFPCDICVFNKDSGAYELAPNAFAFPEKLYIYTLSIVPRNSGYEDAVFEVVINDIKYDHDTKARHSSYFKPDIKNPKKAVRISTGDFSTPGYFSSEQAVPKIEKAQPTVILPISTNEFYTADGDYRIRFLALDVGEAANYANVFIKMPDKSFKKIKAHLNENGEFEAVVNKKTIAKMKELAYYIKVNGAVYETSLGNVKSPITVNLIDNSGPEIKLYPEKEECLEADYKPLIHGEYYDISGIDLNRCELYVDNKNMTAKTVWCKNKFKCQITNEMKAGKHRIDLLVFDFKGNRTYIRRSFHISDCDNSDMKFYRGEIHAHTADSDGVYFIEDAMKYARDIGKVDFFAVTEHSHYINDDIYQKQIDIANDFYIPNKFAALYGFEMTWNNITGYFGHMNVIGTDWIEHNVENVDLKAFYNELKEHKNAVAMFNHPGYPWGNFDDYALHDAEIDKRVCLAEIKGSSYDIEYMTALNKGWHIAPVCNEDNHAANWTTATPSISVVIAPALTRANILNAFRKRRAYSTTDPTMKIVYKINDEWMGSHLDAPSELNISIDIQTESVNGIGKISIVAEDNITIMSFDAASLQSFNANLVLPAVYDYYYLKITSQGQYTVTSPIWIENRKKIRIQNLSVGLSNDLEKPHTVSFSVVNTSEFKAKNVMADIYLSPLSGFDIDTAIPYESIYIDKLDPEQSYTIMRRLPDNKYHRVTVVINGLSKKLECADTEFVLISPVSITEVMPNTSDKEQFPEIKNPFPYIKIHNNTNQTLALDDMLLRYWNKTGKQPLPNKTSSLKGMKISPSDDMVIWIKSNEMLTVDDFNKFHNSNYIEGENLYITTLSLASTTTEGRRLDIVKDGQVISRIHYNYGISKDTCKSEENKVLYYDYLPSITATSYPTTEKPKIRYEKVVSNYTREKTLKRENSKTKNAKSKKPVSISNQTKNKVIGALSTVAAGAIVVAAAVIKDKRKSKKIKKEQDTKKKS